jgi:hypothetical protein
MEMDGKLNYEANLSAVVIRKDGTRTDLGIISYGGKAFQNFVKQLRRFFKSLVRKFGLAVAIALIAAWSQDAHLPVFSLPICLGIVTTAGVNYMAADFRSGGVTPTISGMKFHDAGTGSVAAATTDTALGTPWGGARVSGAAGGSTNVYQTQATIPFTSSFAITEWGLFSAASVGTLWDRRVFAAINVNNGDSIQFTYQLTIAAGGT